MAQIPWCLGDFIFANISVLLFKAFAEAVR